MFPGQATSAADDSLTQVQKQDDFETDTERMEIPPGLLNESAPEDYQTDTERMETLEQRFQALEGKVNASSAPKPKEKETFPTHRITGFLQLDQAVYSQDPLNMAIVGDAQNATGFRRARLAVLGKVTPKTLYQIEVDFATAGRPSFFDNYLEQEDIPFFGAVRAGQYLQPFSVDAMSGFRNLPFLERSLPFLAFVPFRRVGAMASNNSEDERTYWAYSVFHTGGFNNAPVGDSQFATDIGDVGGYSFSTRITHLLSYVDDTHDVWHIGGAYNFSSLGANDAKGSGATGNAGGGPHAFYQAKTTPEFGPLGQVQNQQSFGSAASYTPTFVDTGRYAAHSFNLVGLETVYQDGPLSFQSEWMLTQVNSVVGSIVYHGAYAEVMYRLTGEPRPYDKKLAALRNVVPDKDFIPLGKEGKGFAGWGAWELAARLSYVELRNPSALSGHYYNSTTNKYDAPASSGALGNGTLTDLTIGGTWFLNRHSKVQFDWIHAFLNNSARGFSSADLYVSRVQVDF
jgi:phosphate-selective porin OprO/OprP